MSGPRRSASALLLAALALPFAGCGYALVGKGGAIDPSIKRIGVPVFKDSTGKTGLDQKITQKVIEELLKRGRIDVVQEAAGVDALVEGQLVSYLNVPVGFSDVTATGQTQTQTQASRYAIGLTARVRYTKTGAEQPLWESESFTVRDEYEVGEDPASYFDREEQAIERLATSFARSLVAAMLENF